MGHHAGSGRVLHARMNPLTEHKYTEVRARERAPARGDWPVQDGGECGVA